MSYNGILLSIHYNVDGDYLFIIHLSIGDVNIHISFFIFKLSIKKDYL